ncbi:tetratricopeptide repeat protein [Micromonospora sp. HSS6-12]|uniref:Tetratricopeptide repeat protein n=2 Tax=Micromonospora thermarum TaxID=2720024 RepID=A0ABX0Z6M4_9ACTN|nr:tetratricopeptide repeat protein [Micromonospora thermarum]
MAAASTVTPVSSPPAAPGSTPSAGDLSGAPVTPAVTASPIPHPAPPSNPTNDRSDRAHGPAERRDMGDAAPFTSGSASVPPNAAPASAAPADASADATPSDASASAAPAEPAVAPARPAVEPPTVTPSTATTAPASDDVPRPTSGAPVDVPADPASPPAPDAARSATDAAPTGADGDRALPATPEGTGDTTATGTGSTGSETQVTEDGPGPHHDGAPGGTRLSAQGDPEQILASYRWQLDPATLREIVTEADEFRVIRRRLTEKLGTAVDNRSRARLLSLRAVVSRILGDLDDALADGRLALTYAETTGELRRTALAQARLAHVLRWRGEYDEADRLLAEANSPELPDRLRATLHEHAGRCCFDQGRLMEACDHFERALNLRGAADPELLERVRMSLDAVTERATGAGFGPYPRSLEELLERDRPPVPARDGERWGYADPDGDLVIDAEYAEAQPFREGVAWVRRPTTDRWSLIDLTGATVLEPSWLAVRPFSDGLAWVSHGEPGGWRAIDATGEVVVQPGFAEVRPFRRGVAAVRREGWGAVDRTGRIVVPTRYHGFATTLADGRHVDGFTDEGLAVVDVAGRYGVVDRTGRVVVPPVHPALVVHPVAFLVAVGTGRWGALDRRGEPLIDPVHPDRDEVRAEIERLLTDTVPVI